MEVQLNIKSIALKYSSIITFICLLPRIFYGNPDGGIVTAGDASINNVSPNKLEILQRSDKAIIDWQNFNISSNEHTHFNQPSADSIALNRIHSHEESKINGNLSANGKLILINQNGIIFGENAKVDVHGLLATTSNIDNQEFMAANAAEKLELFFDQKGRSKGKIINQGKITAKRGLVGLVAPNVINTGLIIAKTGKVRLSSGDRFTLDLYGDDLLAFGISEEVKKQIVKNEGEILADGGSIALTTSTGQKIINSLIVNTGAIMARSIESKNGEIIIAAAGSNAVKDNIPGDKGKIPGNSKVLIKGLLNVSGVEEGERGGKLKITGDHIALLDGTLIDASGHSGNFNTTTKDDRAAIRKEAAGGEILIGGNYLGRGKVPAAKNLYVDPQVLVFNDAIEKGDAGRTIFWSDGETRFYGQVFSRALGGIQTKDLEDTTANLTGNPGDGGFVETSGKYLIANGFVDGSAVNGAQGTYLLDPTKIIIYGNTATLDPTTSRTKLNYLNANETSELLSSYIRSLNTDVWISADQVVLDLAGQQVDWGSKNVNIFAQRFLEVKSGGKITLNGYNLGFEHGGSEIHDIDFSNLTLDTSSTAGGVNFTFRGGNVTMGDIITLNAGINHATGSGYKLIFQQGKTGHITNYLEANLGYNNILVFDLKNQETMNMPSSKDTTFYTNFVSAINVGPTGSNNLPCTLLSNTNNTGGNFLFHSYNGGTLDFYNIGLQAINGGIALRISSNIAQRPGSLRLGNMKSSSIEITAATDVTFPATRTQTTIDGFTNTNPYNNVVGVGTSGSGSIIFDLEGLNNINIFPGSKRVDFSTYNKYSMINIGPNRTTNDRFTMNFNSPLYPSSTNITFGSAGTADIDFSNVNINNPQTVDIGYGGINFSAQKSNLKIGSFNGRSLGAETGSAAGVFGNVFLMPFSTSGVAGVSIWNRYPNDSSNLYNNIILDLQGNTINFSYGGDIKTNAAITVISPGTINLTNASTVLRVAGNTGIDISKLTIMGNKVGSATITSSASSITLGTINAGTISVTANNNITIPAGNTITAGATTNPLTFTAGGNYINEAGSSAIIITGGVGVTWKVTSANLGSVTYTNTVPAITYLSVVPSVSNAKNIYYGDPLDLSTLVVKANPASGTFANVKYLVNGYLTTADQTNDVIKGNATLTTNYAVGSGVGTYNITFNTSGLSSNFSNYAFTATTQTVNNAIIVNPRPLTITAVPKTKIYGDSDPALTYNYNATDLVNNDNATIITGSLSRTSGNNVGNYPILVNNLSAGQNYTITFTSANLIILPKNVSLSVNGNITKQYDGTTNINSQDLNLSISGIVGNDNVSVDYANFNGSYDNKNLGTLKSVNLNNLQLQGLHKNNYILGSGNLSATTGSIIPKVLNANVTGISKTYDGSTKAVLTNSNYQNLVGVVASEQVSLVPVLTGNFNDKNAGNKTVTIIGVKMTGRDVGNYTINYSDVATKSISVAGNIVPKALNLALQGNISKVYDGSTSVKLTDSHYGKIIGILGSDNVNLVKKYTANFNTKDSGTANTVTVSGLSLSGNDQANYVLANPNLSLSHSLKNKVSILPKLISLNLTVVEKQYDGGNKVNLGNYGLNGKIAQDDLNLINPPTQATFDSTNIGAQKKVTITGLQLDGNDKNNYNLPNTIYLSGTIKPRELAIGLRAGISKVYDGKNTIKLTVDDYTALTGGVIGNDDVKASLPGTGFYDNKNVGQNKTIRVEGVILSGKDQNKYRLNANNLGLNLFSKNDAVITPCNLTIKFDNKQKVYGSRDPALTYTPISLASGDTIVNSLSGSGSREPGENVGNYAIKLQGLGSLNYNLIQDLTANSSLTISKANLVVTANSFTKKYLAVNPNFTVKILGLKNNDSTDLINNLININCTAINSTPKGKYSIVVTGPNTTANYNIKYVNGVLSII